MKHKTSELDGLLLDQAVARAEGYTQESDDATAWKKCDAIVCISERGVANGYGYRPSSAWVHGGPIIEREQIVYRHHDGGSIEACVMRGTIGVNRRRLGKQFGTTLLQAAMRAFVASKFGEEIDL